MGNKVKYNLRNVHYAKITESAAGTITYGTPVAIPGAVSLSLDQEGGRNVFYADGVEYFTVNNNRGYSGDLEIAMVPESFRKDILGDILDANGVLVENADAATTYFALLFEFQGDVNNVRHVLYKCSAERPSLESQTKEEDVEVQTETLSLSASLIYNEALDTYIVKSKTGDETTAAQYAAWYEAVYQPTAAEDDPTP